MKNPQIKYLLDTSIQISRCNPAENRLITTNLKNSKPYTSYFVKYEFLSGFIKSLIDYYSLVNITESPAVAMGEWSNKFGRANKYKTLLDAQIALISKSIDFSQKSKYMRQIEAAIFSFYSNFSTGILFVGEFGSDDVVRTVIHSRNDFESLTLKIRNRPQIPLDSFWGEHNQELKLIIDALGSSKRKPIITLNQQLTKISENKTEANKPKTNFAIGDVVIAVDCPPSLTLLTTDSRFDLLCPPLSKMHKKIAKEPVRTI